ncbi:hypothetical protein L873DRAFT_1717284 [Choiromyces venosus 120613-1]|uniref:BAH domain-containing protein n=1 Tax=Choiromyces venosus 120613-1 TaxID=1336337 RepID=A0A3N4J1U5_9PEZI|nr:hypothetical protein L873DRAFT_1717284 [Choiromyces venosus 120613-1]
MPPKRKRSGGASENAVEPPEEQHSEQLVNNNNPNLIVSDCPFTVEYKAAPISAAAKKKKKGILGNASGSHAPRQAKRYSKSGVPINPVGASRKHQEVDRELPLDSTLYAIKPRKQWDQLTKYRSFVVGTENFALNEHIFVNHSNIPHGTDLGASDDKKFWVARVLEIRAVDESHVYLRVYWLYWPEELPGGRQPYHGAKEIIASNHMEIIDAMTVSGRATVKHWMELDEEEDLPDLFWRQKFDYPSQMLMEVREHCKCRGYYNPDKVMFACTSCKMWQHEECLIADIKKRVYQEIIEGPSSPPLPAPPPPPTNNKHEEEDSDEEGDESMASTNKSRRRKRTSTAMATTTTPISKPQTSKSSSAKGKYVAAGGEKGDFFQVVIRPELNGPVVAVVRDLRSRKLWSDKGGKWEEGVKCLGCGKVVS